MRLVVTSDVHRRTSALFDIVERHIDNADLFINLGDSMNEIEELLMVYPNLKIECVAGNCDFGSTYALTKLLECGGKRIFITHACGGWTILIVKFKSVHNIQDIIICSIMLDLN